MASKLPFTLFLAARYLKPKRSFLSIITVISVLGVTLGIALLIVVMSVMTGFGRELQRKVMGFEAHLVVTNGGLMENWRDTLKTIEADPEIVAAAPFVMGPVVAEHNHRRMAPKVRAIDLAREQKVSDIGKFLIAGDKTLEGDSVILGSGLAEQLGAWVGDTINVYSPGNLDALLNRLDALKSEPGNEDKIAEIREMVLPTELTVTGIFESGRYTYDSDFLLVPLHIGQELYALGDAVHGLSLKTTDPYRAATIRDNLAKKIPPDVSVSTWMEMNAQLFDAIKTERSLLFFLMLCVSVVAGFCIMNTLITVTVLKTREIGILKALGARTGQIVGVFMAQGIVVGVFGVLSGLALGLGVVILRNQIRILLSALFGVQVFPQGIYEFAEIPAQIVPYDVAVICLSSFLICAVSALIPAWFAARLDPVKALRYE